MCTRPHVFSLRALLVSILGAAGLQAADPSGPRISTNAPVKNFSLPSFNDAGFRTMLIRGREAVIHSEREIRLSDMTLTLFSGDETTKVETVLVSPTAVIDPAEQLVTGQDFVRLIGQDVEVSGSQWRYEHGEKRILIGKDARVVFRTELKDILR